MPINGRLDKKPQPQVRFLGFSGSLMIFSDSQLVTRSETDQRQEQKQERPAKP